MHGAAAAAAATGVPIPCRALISHEREEGVGGIGNVAGVLLQQTLQQRI